MNVVLFITQCKNARCFLYTIICGRLQILDFGSSLKTQEPVRNKECPQESGVMVSEETLEY